MKKHFTFIALLCASVMAFAADNLALNKETHAGKYPADDYRPALAVDGNKGSRWASGSGAQHYASVGEAAEDWWYVDLGAIYNIDSIRIWFETAAPTDYDLLVSNNAAAWTVIGTYTEAPNASSDGSKHQLYEFTDKVGRYVKIFARQGYSNLAYGISMWEFEVFGTPGASSDTNKPTMVSASVSGDPAHNQVNIAVSATDIEDGTVNGFRVQDATHGVDQNLVATAGIITVTGLEGEVEYNFSVTAVDNAGNESENAIVVNVTTPQDPTIPHVAAPVPTRATADVRPVYSDAYPSILAHAFALSNWGSVVGVERAISGDHFLQYDLVGHDAVIWGENNAGANAIVAIEGYNAGGEGDNTGVDASAMDSLHMDVWSLVAMSNIQVRINDNMVRAINLTGEGWQSIDIALAEPVEAINTTSVRWFKITNIVDPNRQKLAFDNIYFYKKASTTPTALVEVESQAEVKKAIVNGMLVIEKNGVKYNVLGNKL